MTLVKRIRIHYIKIFTDFGREICGRGVAGDGGLRWRRRESRNADRAGWLRRLIRRPTSGAPLTEPDQRAPEHAHDWRR